MPNTKRSDKLQETHELAIEIPLELESFLNTDPQKGLSRYEVDERLAKFGLNGK